MAAKGKMPTAAAVAGLLSWILVWGPPFAALFIGFIFDMNQVFLHNFCLGISIQTCFVFSITGLLMASWLLGNYTVPHLFRGEWEKMDPLKKRKLIGYFIKIGVRIPASVLMLFFVMRHFSWTKGLFSNLNVGEAYLTLIRDNQVQACNAVASTGDIMALHAWEFSKASLMAVLVWELAYIPELPWDSWMHHLFVIFLGTFSLDDRIVGIEAGNQPFLDAVGFWLVLGACLSFTLEAYVLGYHMGKRDPSHQACWMLSSCIAQIITLVIFYTAIPLGVLFGNWSSYDWRMRASYLCLIVLLALVELHLTYVKLIITAKKRKQAAKARASHKGISKEEEGCGSFAEPSADLLAMKQAEAESAARNNGSGHLAGALVA